MHYFISAGEASGDLHASALIRELRARDPQARFTFLGGDEMTRAAGSEPLIHYRRMAFMGFAEVLRHLPQVLGNLRRAKAAVAEARPDALVLVDYPSFNLKLARHAHALGIPVYYYISPKVWAWKEWRVKDIRRYCRRVLSILPFEVPFFNRHGMEVTYVGNPSREEIDDRLSRLPSREEFCSRHHLDPALPILALVPGSRMGEIRNNLPVMVRAASQFPHCQAVVAGAPGIAPGVYPQFSSLPVVHGATFELMALAGAALVTSGTATLECALAGTPQVVCYRGSGSRLFYNTMKHFIKCPWVSLPNLIAGREVVPELLMHLCNPAEVEARLRDILPGAPGREHMLDGYALIRRNLGSSPAAANAASAIINDLDSLS